jgi:hypothetical protein
LGELIEEVVEIQRVAVRDGRALAWAGGVSTLGAVGCRLLGAPLPSTPMTPTPMPGPAGAGGR